jgi:PAS domain S-box-containing protein
MTGEVTSWNPAAERIFGHPATGIIGRSIQLIIPPERAEEEPMILARLAQGERVDHFETMRLRADGALIDISATISPLVDGSGRIVGASKIARDITEKKAHERRLRAQFERLSLLQHITRAIGDRQDLESIHQVVSRTLEEQMPADYACVAPYDAITETLDVAYSSSPPVARLDGRQRVRIPGGLMPGALIYEPDIATSTLALPSMLSGMGLRSLVFSPLSVQNRIPAVLIIARLEASSFTSIDCEFISQLSEHLALASHQTELLNSLQAAYDDLRRTQNAIMQQERLRALGQMASGVAHDINNALSPPALYVQILLQHDKTLSREARDYLEIIGRALDDVSNTIARLRTFYGARDQELALTTLDLNLLLEQIAEITRVRWSTMPQRHGSVIELNRDLAGDLPKVMGTEGDIRDALTNLVFNAVDAMPTGGTVTLQTRIIPAGASAARDPLKDHVAVEVRDTGVGMTEAVRARCLEPFFSTKGQRGTGLGLAMVYGMAQRHGADLQIESEEGVGTTVRLLFPVAAADQPSEAPALPVTAPPTRVLVVDDDPLVLKSLREALQADGHTVITADGGRQGIEEFLAARARAEAFGIVFTDLGMPNVDGRRVAQSIKALEPNMPVVLLTGWGQRLRDDNDIPDHVDRVLSKPPNLHELRAVLAEFAGPSIHQPS